MPKTVPISFEFYPPKTDEQRASLDRSVAKLKQRAPDYVSVTFGAGGSTLSYTPETVRHLRLPKLDQRVQDLIAELDRHITSSTPVSQS